MEINGAKDLEINKAEDLEINKAEDLEINGAKDLEINGACCEYLDPETANDVELMKSAVISKIEKTPGIIASRKITSKNAGGTKCGGIYVSYDVYRSLKRGGEIYEEVLRRFKVKLVVRKPPGRKRADADETMTRLCEISW